MFTSVHAVTRHIILLWSGRLQMCVAKRLLKHVALYFICTYPYTDYRKLNCLMMRNVFQKFSAIILLIIVFTV